MHTYRISNRNNFYFYSHIHIGNWDYKRIFYMNGRKKTTKNMLMSKISFTKKNSRLKLRLSNNWSCWTHTYCEWSNFLMTINFWKFIFCSIYSDIELINKFLNWSGHWTVCLNKLHRCIKCFCIFFGATHLLFVGSCVRIDEYD